MMGDENSKLRSFSTCFWGPESKGYDVLLARMKRSKRISEEVCSVLKERSSMEEEYGKKLAKMAKNFTPLKEDKGTMLESLAVIRNELERSARAHLDLSQDLKSKICAPLQDVIDSQAAIRKNHQKIMDRSIQLKTAQEQYVTKCRDRYEQKWVELASLEQSLKGLPLNVPAKEIEKVKSKIERVQMQIKQAEGDYRAACDKLAEIHVTWRADMAACSVDFEKLEEDRYLFMRANLWKYANFLSDTCVLNDQSAERIRVSLEQCSFESDMAIFMDAYGTGTEIPEPQGFVPCQLDTRFNNMAISDTISESSRASVTREVPLGFADGKKNSVTGSGHLFSFQKANIATHSATSSGRSSTSANPPAITERSFLNNSEIINDSSIMESTFLYDPFEVHDKTTILFTVRVLYDYKSQAREEMDIRKGQIIPVTATHDDGWWEGLGYEDGRRRKGLFPSNFTEHAN